jgi:hydrogenase maturation protease
VKIIGVGNPDRGDDAAGWEVVARIVPRTAAMRSTGDPAGLIEEWRGCSDVVLVDATSCERPPGTITVIDLLEQRLPHGAVNSSHGLGPVEAVELGRALGVLPDRLTFVGIEGSRWDAGSPLSDQVERAVDRVVTMLEEWNGERRDQETRIASAR